MEIVVILVERLRSINLTPIEIRTNEKAVSRYQMRRAYNID